MAHKFNHHKQMQELLQNEFPRIREDQVVSTILDIIEKDVTAQILVF